MINKWLSTLLIVAMTYAIAVSVSAQTLPGDTVVYGPMFSPVYNNSVRVWVLTENRGTGANISLELKSTGAFSTPLNGQIYQSDTRLGYSLRTYLYTGLASGQTYTATILHNGAATARSADIKNENSIVDDFSFLSGGCARIYDLSRCIDRPEAQTHVNGDPAIFNRMANEDSDMMIWLGDAVYLLGLQHAMGQCPDAIDDWANKDTAFARYMFYRQFHDKLLQSMPQLAITDNHDTGPNEFNKTLPSLNQMKEVFMEWWPNPEYKSTPEGQGLFSSYKYKDVEYFLFDNRSFRDDTKHHLGPDQFNWLKDALRNSNATFKILINATPSFAKHWGGRNFSVTEQGDELVQYIQDNNIDGVISFSADIHRQEFFGRYDGVKYPLYDVLSGNLNSDIGNGAINVNYGSDTIMNGTRQTYLKVSLFGPVNNRRMKVAYQDLNGNPYFESIIHEDMLTTVEDRAKKLALSFSNNLDDSSSNNYFSNGTNTYGQDRNGEAGAAAEFNNSEVQVWASNEITLHDRAYSIGFWLKPNAHNAAIFSNATSNSGFTLGSNASGQLQYTNHNTGNTMTSSSSIPLNEWSHALWKYDNVKRQLSLYINGSFAQSWNNIISPTANTTDITIGSNFQGRAYNGALDEVIVYGKLLSDSFIRNIAEYQSNRSDVIALEGGQNMSIPGDQINSALANNFTIEFWGRLTADPITNGKILSSNSRVDGNSAGLSFEFPESNRLNVVAGTNGSGWNVISEAGNPWNVGEWNHVALSATTGGNMVYYINGIEVGSAAFAGYVPNPTGLGLGDSPHYGSDVRAELEELKIWNRALSQNEIRENMHRSINGVPSNLVFYYDFNGQGTGSITSKGSNAYTIAMNGASIIPGSAPVSAMPSAFNNNVGANWSIRNNSDNGLSLNNTISNFNSSVVIGRQSGSGISVLSPADGIDYLNAGWRVDPSNITSGNIVIDLAKATSNPGAITSIAAHYHLIKGNPNGNYSIVSTTSASGNIVTFTNVSLTQADEYHIAWKDNSTPTDYPVTIYQHCDYNGYSVNLTEGDWDLNQLQAAGMLNDDISSLRIANGFEIVMYQHHQFSGNSTTITSDDNCLVNEGWNDDISSLRIRRVNNSFTLTTQAENYSDSLGIQLEGTSDTGGGQNVGWIDAGDWLAYSNITLPSAGAYTIEYRVASASGGGTLSADLNSGATQLGSINIPSTGGWQNWTTLSQTVNIDAAGTYSFGIFAVNGGWNINWWRITKQ